MDTVVLPEAPEALVAVTVVAKVPVGWKARPPPQPIKAITRASAATPSASLKLRRLSLFATNPASAISSRVATYRIGGILPGPNGRNAEPPAAAAVTVIVTCAVIWLSDGGLKLQVTPGGNPLHANVIAPRPLAASTVKVMEDDPPRGTWMLPLPLAEI